MSTSASSTVSTLRHETLPGDIALSFDDRGSGPAVLVLHGGGGPLTVARFVEAMAAHARVIAPIHPGFGGTPRPETCDSVEQIADAYVELLDRLDLRDVLVIGFSIGGWIANALALRAGNRLRGLVLVNGAGIMVDGEPCADVFSLTLPQLSALSYHDPARFAVDPATLGDAPGKDCDDCMHYIAPATARDPATCRIVDGAISPHGHCIAFTPKPKPAP